MCCSPEPDVNQVTIFFDQEDILAEEKLQVMETSCPHHGNPIGGQNSMSQEHNNFHSWQENALSCFINALNFYIDSKGLESPPYTMLKVVSRTIQ